jgi:hypothetical protein
MKTIMIKVQVEDYKHTKPSTYKIVMELSLSFDNAATLPSGNAIVEKDGDRTYAVIKRHMYTDEAYADTMSALESSGFAIVVIEGKEVKKFDGKCMSVEQAYDRDVVKEMDDINASIREIERTNELIREFIDVFDRENAYLEASHRCIERIYNKHKKEES